MNVSGVMLPPEWLPTISTGPLLGDVPEVADLAAEPEARDQPEQRQLLAKVIGVAVVEVGRQPLADARGRRGRRPGRRLLPGLRERPGEPPPGASEVRRRPRDAAADAPDARRAGPGARASPPSAAPPPLSLRALGDRPLVGHHADSEGWVSGAMPPAGCGPRTPPAMCSRISPLVRSASSTCGTWPHSGQDHLAWPTGAPRRRGGRTPAGTSRSLSPQTNSAGGRSSARRVQSPRSPCGASR